MTEFVVLAVVIIGGATVLGGIVGYMIFKMWEELADK